MPELPEVQTVVCDLRERLQYQVLDKTIIHDPDVLKVQDFGICDLEGLILQDIQRRGKYIVYNFGPRAYVIQHLRMTGQMLPVDSAALPDRVKPIGVSQQIRFSWIFEDGSHYVFFDTRRFGTLELVTDAVIFFQNKGLAPDTITDTHLARKCFLTRTGIARKSIKACLLDQSITCGVGNIYADEALHLSKIHPAQKAALLTLQQRRKVFANALRVMRQAISKRGTSMSDYLDVNGNPGIFKKYLSVYRRTGEMCKSCKVAVIESTSLAGRTTHYCPRCQPAT